MKVSRIAGQCLSWGRVFVSVGLVLVAAVVVLALGSKLNHPGIQARALASSSQGSQARVQAVGQIPLSFEPNRGQTDTQVKYLARGSQYALFLTSDEAVLKLQHFSPKSHTAMIDAVRMKLIGAAPSTRITPSNELQAKSNYFVGNDPSKWHSNIPHYGQVRYEQVYPGIDLVYYGNQGRLEYDFNVAPGGDPRNIQLNFAGQRRLKLDREGNLLVQTSAGDVRFQPPVAYQQIRGERHGVSSRYVLAAGNRVGFSVGNYDAAEPLIIDPTLNYSSYLGGSGQEACGAITGTPAPGCPAIAVDAALNYYVAGSTTSADFPKGTQTTPPPFQAGLAAGATANVFVAKFNLANTLLVSTYLGGNGIDTTAGVGVDLAGNIYVGGTTTSSNFPTANGYNPGPASGTHVFVSELKPDASALLYSTYLAGSGTDTASGLAVDGKGAAFVTGVTTSVSGTNDFPTTSTALQQHPLSTTTPQFFVSKIDTTKAGSTSLAYSTFFGGATSAGAAVVQGGGIAVDSTGNAYITGGTNYLHLGNTLTDFPILNAAQDCLHAVGPPPNPPACVPTATLPDAFVAKFNPNTIGAASLLYSTYLGGSGTDIGYGIAVDSGSNAYVTGSTDSTDEFKPASLIPYQAALAGGTDAFLAKLNNPAASGTVGITYFTYLGGSGADLGAAVAADSSGNARVTGWTSGGFPSNATAGFTPGPLGGGDAFVARIDTSGSQAAATNDFVSAFGGTGVDHGTGIAVDANFSTYVVGDTASGDFPKSSSPFQAGLNGTSDAFVSRLQPVSDVLVTAKNSTTAVGVGNPVTFSYTVTNAGPDPTGGVTFTDNIQTTNGTFGTITSSPGTCTAPTGGIAQCAIGTLVSGGTATVTVTATPTAANPTFQNSGTVSAGAFSSDPNPNNNSASASVAVDDFSLTVSPNSQTVTAGQQPAPTYQVTVTPIPTFPNAVSLSCSSGLPAGASCAFSTTSVTTTNTSPATSTLTISTTARPVTTTWLRRSSALMYALFLPVSGFTLLGAGVTSRRRKWLLGLCLAAVLGTIAVGAGCGSKSSTPATTGGTPAGTYTVTVTGTSGTATRSQNVTLVVN